MPSNSVKWIVSIVFGLLIGRVSYGVILPLMMPLSSVIALDSPDTLIVTGLVMWLVVTVIASVALARIPNLRRLIGWGCVVLGVALMLTIPITLLSSDLGGSISGGTQAANDAKTALFFWVLIFALPYLGGGLALAILGAVLIRKNPPARDAVAA